MNAKDLLDYCQFSGNFYVLFTNRQTLTVEETPSTIEKAFVFKENLIIIFFGKTADNQDLTTITFIKTSKKFLELKYKLEQHENIHLEKLNAAYIVLEKYDDQVNTATPQDQP